MRANVAGPDQRPRSRVSRNESGKVEMALHPVDRAGVVVITRALQQPKRCDPTCTKVSCGPDASLSQGLSLSVSFCCSHAGPLFHIHGSHQLSHQEAY